MKKKFTFLLTAFALLACLAFSSGKVEAQSISPEPTSISLTYGEGNTAPEGQYVYVSCANLGVGNDVTVSLGDGANSPFELWDTQSNQGEWTNLTQFTATNTDQYWFGFGFVVRLKPGYAQGSTHTDVVNLTATVGGNTVAATIDLSGTVTAPTYSIEFELGNNPHGYVTASPSPATAGAEVGLNIIPSSGYQFDTWTFYRKDNNEVVTPESINLVDLSSYPYAEYDYEFLMPAFDLKVVVSFVSSNPNPYPAAIVPSPAEMELTYGLGNDAPEGQYVWINCVNLGDDGFAVARLDKLDNSDFELWYLDDPDQTGWNGRFHVYVEGSDPYYFGFGLLVRLKPGLPIGTYTDVITLLSAAATSTITLTGTVTEVTYSITFDLGDEYHGWVAADPSPATAGTTVTLTRYPETGYELASLIVKKQVDDEWVEDPDVTITDNQFEMPAYDVQITPTFAPYGPASISFTDNYMDLEAGEQSGTIPMQCTNLVGVDHWEVVDASYSDCTIQTNWIDLSFTGNNSDGYSIVYDCPANPLAIERLICFKVKAYDANNQLLATSDNYETIVQVPETPITTTRAVYGFWGNNGTLSMEMYTVAPEGSSLTVVSSQGTPSDWNAIPAGQYIELQLSDHVDHAIKALRLDMMASTDAAGYVEVYYGDNYSQLSISKLANIGSASSPIAFTQWPNAIYGDCYLDLDVQMSDLEYAIQANDVVKIRITTTIGTLYCRGLGLDYTGKPSFVLEKWYKTDLDDILEGDEFVIAGYKGFHYFGMNNDASGENEIGKTIELELSSSNENELIRVLYQTEVTSNVVWTLTRSQGKYYFKPKGTDNYLKYTAQDGLYIGTGTENADFEFVQRPIGGQEYYLYRAGYYLTIGGSEYYDYSWTGYDANHVPGQETRFYKKTYEYQANYVSAARSAAVSADHDLINIKGVVSYKNGDDLYLQDSDNGLILVADQFIDYNEYLQINEGDEIIVRGKPYDDETNGVHVPTMHDVVLIEVMSQGNTVTPMETTIQDLLDGVADYNAWTSKDYCLVKLVNATVSATGIVSEQNMFSIRQGESPYADVVNNPDVAVAIGNTVNVTGIFTTFIFNETNQVKLEARTADDLEVFSPHQVNATVTIQNETNPDPTNLPSIGGLENTTILNGTEVTLTFPQDCINNDAYYHYQGLMLTYVDQQNETHNLDYNLSGDGSTNTVTFTMPNHDVNVEV